ncbi:MAG: hypothetical protein ABW061_18765 [Polyangiaceae bacterium]
MAQSVSSLKLVADYVQEQLSIVEVLTARVSSPLLATAQASPTSPPEPIALDADLNLTYYRFEPTSASGYVAELILASGPLTQLGSGDRLLAFFTAGLLNVIYVPTLPGTAPVWRLRNAAGQWQDAAVAADVMTWLSNVASSPNGSVLGSFGNGAWFTLVYGSQNGASFLVLFDTSLQQWGLLEVAGSSLPGPLQVVLGASDTVEPTSPLTLVCSVGTGSTANATISLCTASFLLNIEVGNITSLQVGTISTPKVALKLAPDDQVASWIRAQNALDTLFALTNQGQLFMAWGLLGKSPQTIPVNASLPGKFVGPLPGVAGVAEVSVREASAGSYAVLCTDRTTGALLIGRQSKTGSKAQFAIFETLGMNPSALAAPPYLSGGLELFFYGAPNQDSASPLVNAFQPFTSDGSGAWQSTNLATPKGPGDSMLNTQSYTGYVIALDSNATPVAGATISITSDTAATLVIGGIAGAVRPGWPAIQGVTGPDGRLLLQVLPSTMMSAPQLLVSVAGVDKPAPLYLDAQLLARMAGNDPTRPFTYETLLDSPSGPGFDPGNPRDDQEDVSNWIGALQALAKKGVQLQGGSSSTPAADATFVLRRRPGKVSVTRAESFEAALASIDGGIAEWFDDTFGDAVAYVEDKLSDVADWVVSVGDKIQVTFVWLGNTITRIVNASVTAVKQVIDATIDFVAEAWDFVVNVAKFFGNIFSWSDICNTQQVIEHMITTALGQVPAWTQNVAGPWVQTQVSALQAQIQALLQTAAKTLGVSLADDVKSHGGVASLTSGGVGGALNGGTADIQSNWFWDRTVRNQTVSAQLAALSPTLDDGTAFDSLIQFAQPLAAGFNSSSSDQSSVLQLLSSFKWSSLSDFANATAAQVLQLIANFASSLLQQLGSLADFAVSSLGDFATTLLNALNQPIAGVPFLSDLIEYLNDGQALTFLNAISLALAIPVTAIFKLVQCVANPVAPFSAAYVQSLPGSTQILPPWSSFASPSSGASVLRDGGTENRMLIQGVFQAMLSLTDTVHDYRYINEEGVGWLVPCAGAAALFGAWMLGAPYDQWQVQPADRSDADKSTIKAWWFVIGQITVEVFLAGCALAADIAEARGSQTLAQWLTAQAGDTKLTAVEAACPYLKGLSGVAAFVAAVLAASDQYANKEQQADYTPLTATALWLPTLPAVTRFGLLAARASAMAPPPLSAWAKVYQIWQLLIADVGLNLATTILLIIQSGSAEGGEDGAPALAQPLLAPASA